MRISFILAGLSGIIILISFIITMYNIKSINTTSLIIILLLLSIGIGIHGMQHSTEEIYYDFNPLVGKWKLNDDVQKENLCCK
jgi:disulfide bond formation protein DsbB